MAGRRGTRLGRWLIRLLPIDVREQHGLEMQQVLAAGNQEREPGFAGGLRFWLRALADVLRVAPRQHLEALCQDVRYGWRTLRRSPGFAAAALITISFGSGAALAVFVVVNAVLIRPLPFAEPSRLALIWSVTAAGSRTWLSAPELDDLSRRASSFEAVAGFTDLRLALTGGGAPEELDVAAASSSLFPLLGVSAHAGRLFESSDDLPSSARVAVLSHGLWTRRFGASADVIGRSITLDGRSYAVVGVLPRAFELVPPSSVFPRDVAAWVALQPHLVSRERDVRFLHAVARLQRGVGVEAARRELAGLGEAMRRVFPSAYEGRRQTFDVVAMQADLVSGVRPALTVLAGTVISVLVLAWVNVSALLLARGEGRRREMAVRLALGASRRRLLRQLLAEGFLLACLGGAGATLLAAAVPQLSHVPGVDSLPRFADLSLDWRVYAVGIGVTALATVLFGLAPALELRDNGPGRAAEDGRSAGAGRAATRARRLLVSAEIALASTVLVVALLFARSLVRVLDAAPGFATDRVLSARVSLPPKYATADAIGRFFTDAVDGIRRLPGVDGAAAVTQLPLSGAVLGSSIRTEDDAGKDWSLDVDLRGVTPAYFEVMAIPLLRGRPFTERDRRQAPPVAIVDESTARRLWPGRDPLGRHIRWIRQPDVSIEVVGVVGAVRHRGLEHAPRATVYRPHLQYPRSTMYLVARAGPGQTLSAGALGSALHALDPDQPIAEPATLEGLRRRSLARPKFGAAVGAALAALALMLTMVGVHGLYALAVVRRRREIGIRLAIGSTPQRIAQLILAEGIVVALVGLGVGLPSAFLATQWIAAGIGEFARPSAGILTVTAALMLGVAVVSCWIPARRASRVDPTAVLRAEP